MNSFLEKDELCQGCEYQENLKILRDINFFSQMPMEVLKVFAYLCTREHFKAGEYLFQQHEDPGQAFYIVSGSAGLMRSTGKKKGPLREYDAGEFIGGLSLWGGMRQLYSLKVLTDMVCLMISREKFQQALEQFPQLQPKVIQTMLDRIRTWEERLLVEHVDNCEECIGKMGVTLV